MMRMRILLVSAMILAVSLLALNYALQQPMFAADDSAGVPPDWAKRIRTDGLGDNSAILQAWIDSGAGDIGLPPGKIRIQKTITVRLNDVGYTSFHGQGVSTLIMAGEGPAIRFVGTHFKSADPGGFSDEVWDRERMPLVDGVGILGVHEAADGIEARGTMQLTISRVQIRNVRHGVHLVENNRNVIISDSHIYENHGVGVFYDHVNLHQSNIIGSHISYNAGGGVVSRQGNVRNIHISGCDLESNMSPGSAATANVLIDCRGSRYGTAEVAITGCTIQHNNPSPESANIRIIGRSDPSATQSLVREGNVTITGNVLSDVQHNIHLKDCRGVAIAGNTLWMGYQHNLLIEDCTNVVFGANNLDRNPRYAYGNTSDANNAVVFRNCADSTISGLHVTGVYRNHAAVVFDTCTMLNVTGCTVLDCDGIGLLFRECDFCRLSDCLVADRRQAEEQTAIRVDGGRGNTVTNNLIRGTVLVDRQSSESANTRIE